MNRQRLARIFWIGAAAALVLAALIALIAVIRGEFSDTDGRILGTLAALVLASGTLIAGLALVERDDALLGRIAIALSPVGFASLAYAIWDFPGGGGDEWRYGWTGALVLVASLIATTARLLAESEALQPLAYATGALATAGSALSIYEIWSDGTSDVGARLLAVLWILTAACYMLIPVVERYRAERSDPEVRVLAELDGVELVLTRSRNGLIVELAPGERIVLRKRR